jgi:hypothetical protein
VDLSGDGLQTRPRAIDNLNDSDCFAEMKSTQAAKRRSREPFKGLSVPGRKGQSPNSIKLLDRLTPNIGP